MSQYFHRVRNLATLVTMLALAALASAQTPDIVHFPFDEGSGNTTDNTAVPGRGDGTVAIQGNPQWETPGRLGTSALDLRGDAYFNTNWNMDLMPGDSWTLEFSIRTNVVNNNAQQYIFADEGAGWNCYIGGNADGGLVINGMDNTSTPFTSDLQVANLRDGNWHHVAMVHDSGAQLFTVYIDGQQQWSLSSRVRADNGSGLVIGGRDDGSDGLTLNLDGDLDEFRVWGDVLTGAEVSSVDTLAAPFASGLIATEGVSQNTMSAVVPGTNNVVVANFNLLANGADEDISSLSISKTGNLADASITAVRLWNDANANGMLDLGEVQMGMDQTFTAGVATFSGAPLLSVMDGNSQSLLVSYDIAGGANGGSTFGAELAQGSITTSTGPMVGTFPATGATFRVFGAVSSLPFVLNFDSALSQNMRVSTAAGTYPTANMTGDVPVGVPTTNDGRAALTTQQFRAKPTSAPYAFAMDAPQTDGVVALDLHFALGIYNANTQTIELSFMQNNVDSQDSSYDNVFISNDGGQNWVASALKLDAPSGRDWVRRTVDLSAALQNAGTNFTATVTVRIQNWENDAFREGVLIDDIAVREVATGLRIANTAASRVGNVAPGSSDVLTQTLEIEAHSVQQDIADLTISTTGTAMDADIAGVSLWADDGDNHFDPTSDTLIAGPTAPTSGAVTFSGLPLISVAQADVDRYFVSVSLAGGIAAGTSFGTSINSAADVVLGSAGPVNGTYPLTGAGFTVLTPGTTFPWTEGFEGALASNMQAVTRAASAFERAPAVGQTQTPRVTSNNPSRVRVGGTLSRSAPATGSNQLALDFPYRGSIAAVDAWFDLSAYDASLDLITFSFDWNEEGANANNRDGLFISFDGGQTFPWQAWRPDSTTTTPYSSYQTVTLNLSQVVQDAAAGTGMGLNFTSSMVLRLQTSGGEDLQSQEGILFDNLSMILAPRLDLQRPAMTSIAAGGTDNAGGSFLTGVPSQLDYTIENAGSGTLSLNGATSVSVANEANVAVTITQPATTTLAAGATTTFSLSLTPAADGAFSFDLTVASDDPTNPNYTITVNGISTSFVEIDVQRPAGTSIADGSMVDLGDVGDNIATSFTFTVENTGNIPLNFTGTMPDYVAVANETNATAVISTQLPATLAAGASTTFVVDVTPASLMAFSFDLLIANDDADEGNYTLNVVGTGVTAEADIDVQFPAGSSLLSGSTHAIGDWQAGTPFMLNYTIENTGNLPLMLTGVPLVETANINNCSVMISTDPADTMLDPAETTTFSLTVTATVAGIFSFDFFIASDDPNENPYLIRVGGNATAAPADIDLAREGTPLADGSSDDLGDLEAGVTIARTWTINNVGSSSLSLTGTPLVAISNAMNCTVTLVAAPNQMIAGGASTTFTLEITPTAAGMPFAFDLSIDSSDTDEPTYNVSVFGNAFETVAMENEGQNHSCAVGGSESTLWLWLVSAFGLVALLMRRRTPKIGVEA